MSIEIKKFGKLKNGESVNMYTLSNNTLKIEILNYGGIIKSIYAPDKNGNYENIVLEFENIEDYEENLPYFGCIVGRVAGRIKGGKIKIDGKIYDLEKNNGSNTLHGGINSFNNKIWKATPVEKRDSLELKLEYVSPHMENGFPGEVKVTVIYILKEGELSIDYEGVPDRETYLSLTNHTYFNLSGKGNEIYDHRIILNSNEYLEVDKETIPIEVTKVNGPFDLKEGKYFKEILLSKYKQLEIVGGGIDHGFILSKDKTIDGRVEDENSGRVLEFITDQPAVVLYTGNYLSDIDRKKHSGFCLETQDYPDVANIFPTKYKIYSPTDIYKQHTTYRFLVMK